jgi:hypothetical protein
VITRKLDSHQQTLVASLDAQRRDVQKAQGSHQRTLTSTINHNHQQQIRKSKDHQKALTSKIDSNQRRVMGNINRSNHLAVRNYQQSSDIARKVDTASQLLTAQLHQTTDMFSTISAQFQRLEISRSGSSVRLRQRGRDIYFLGEHTNMIMAYLLPLQDNLERAVNYILSHHGEDVSVDDARRLQSEFQHLVDSAAQERAAQHPDSDARSFDQWSYPEDTVGYLKADPQNPDDPFSPRSHNSLTRRTRRPNAGVHQKRSKRANRAWSMKTPSGDIRISLPNHKSGSRNTQVNDEFGFSCSLELGQSTYVIDARFLRDLACATQPRVCAQLNVSVIMEYEFHMYDRLIETGSIEEIDTALRKGVISPYHTASDGLSHCLWVSFVPHCHRDNRYDRVC